MAKQQQFLYLRSRRVGGNLIFDECLHQFLRLCKIERPIELAQRGGRYLVQPKTGRAGTIVGRFEKIVHLAQPRDLDEALGCQLKPWLAKLKRSS